jgi:8-oxo-dGTP pyrophosphatase MutT (NUDIX family)
VTINVGALREKLATRLRMETRIDGFRESAVLVPILSEPSREDTVLLTVRRDDLPHHAGQISFPGGKRDPRDTDAAATAIRETSEELGIEPAAVEVLGLLDDIPTPTGFVITPVVARIEGPVELHPSAGEVAAVLRCPVAPLMVPGAFRENGVRTFMGASYAMLEVPFEGHRIWGATARILYQLIEQLGF